MSNHKTDKWSAETWMQADPIYRSILELPFVKQLADGTLDMKKFIFYLEQDAIYIRNYCHVLASIASRLDDQKQTEAFLGFAADGVAVEREMHEVYLKQYGGLEKKPTPACLLYMSYLNSCVTAPVEVQAAAILPCFWIYYKVGVEIAASASADNPFKKWIETYSYPEFEISNNLAIEICDNLAAKASPDVRHRMTEAFIYASKMEWMFWDSAYNLENWKI